MKKKYLLFILSLFSIGTLTSLMNLVEATAFRVLIIDDREQDRDIKERRVKAQISPEVQIDKANDAQDALKKIEAGAHYDLILTDGEMGGTNKNADTLVENLRNKTDWRLIVPIIIHSATLSDWQNNSKISGKSGITFADKGKAAELNAALSQYKQSN